MQKVIVSVVLCALVASALGHAVLRSPTPWNTQPSKTANCGGGTAPGSPSNSWYIGAGNTISWQVIAGDGAGPITVTITPGDQNSFATQGTVLLADYPSPGVGSVTADIVVPANITCPARGCYVQVRSSSAWYSCSSVELLPAGTPIPPKPRQCLTANGLQYCTMLNSRKVGVAVGITATDLPKYELSTASTFYQSVINNPNVIINGAEKKCQDALKTYACLDAFPACGETRICSFWCNNLATNCQINATHAALFDCTDAPNTCSPASSFKPISVLFLIAMGLAFFLAL